MTKEKNYVQTWNKRSQKYVLIETGKRGGMTGEMQSEPFEGVPIKNGKPKPVKEPTEKELENYEDEKTELEKKSESKSDEKPKKKNSILSILTGQKG